MNNKKNDIDDLIKNRLSKEASEFYDDLHEQNVLEMFMGLFKGKNAWINILLNIMILLCFGFLIFCIFQFYGSESSEDLIKWGFGAIILFISVSVMKIYAWMQMDKNALLREVRRLQLLIISNGDK